jgi:hypothetical protein
VSKYVPGSIRMLINFAHTGILRNGAVTRWNALKEIREMRGPDTVPASPYCAIGGTLRNWASILSPMIPPNDSGKAKRVDNGF